MNTTHALSAGVGTALLSLALLSVGCATTTDTNEEIAAEDDLIRANEKFKLYTSPNAQARACDVYTLLTVRRATGRANTLIFNTEQKASAGCELDISPRAMEFVVTQSAADTCGSFTSTGTGRFLNPSDGASFGPTPAAPPTIEVIDHRTRRCAAARSPIELVVRGNGTLMKLYALRDATPPTSACLYNGATLAVGQRVAAGDGCNTCTCMSPGRVACTEVACPATSPRSCRLNGRQVAVGYSYRPLEPECMVCTCLSQGWSSCEAIGCR